MCTYIIYVLCCVCCFFLLFFSFVVLLVAAGSRAVLRQWAAGSAQSNFNTTYFVAMASFRLATTNSLSPLDCYTLPMHIQYVCTVLKNQFFLFFFGLCFVYSFCFNTAPFRPHLFTPPPPIPPNLHYTTLAIIWDIFVPAAFCLPLCRLFAVVARWRHYRAICWL